MAKDAKSAVVDSLNSQMLHGLMAMQEAELQKTAENMNKLFTTYGCTDLNSAYTAFINNGAKEEEFCKKRDTIIMQLKQIIDAMVSIKDAQEAQ